MHWETYNKIDPENLNRWCWRKKNYKSGWNMWPWMPNLMHQLLNPEMQWKRECEVAAWNDVLGCGLVI